MAKNIGIISYNIYGNFTNYGSALQSWALHQAVKKYDCNPLLIDYCPDILKDKNILNPFPHMWDFDDESRRMCELSMPAIRENYKKFEEFYSERFHRTEIKYTSDNFNSVVNNENLTGFICGSDTIFCMDEFGFDDGYYANYHCMQNHSVAYAASFGDPTLSANNCKELTRRLPNFLALGLRENQMIPYIQKQINIPVQRVLDPTLLHSFSKYDEIAHPERLISENYLLYYSRRYSKKMEDYVIKLAHEKNLKIVEISLRATNFEKGHQMYYSAGVEEFLSLVKHSDFVVTNSFHGMIFSIIYRIPFVIFSREQCSNKIKELLELLQLSSQMITSSEEKVNYKIDYESVHSIIEREREKSYQFLSSELQLL